MKTLLTPEYLQQLRLQHEQVSWGRAGASWIPEIVRLMIQFDLRPRKGSYRGDETLHGPRVLDYGAGRRTFSTAMRWLMPQVEVFEYDPGVPEISILPASIKYDLVLCTDVMEHVEEQFVDETFARLREYTKHAAFFNIALSLSKASLPNGQNAHVTVRSADWWENKVCRYFTELRILPHHKGFTFVALP